MSILHIATLTALVAAVVPAVGASAQSDQVIVLSCTYDPNPAVQTNITLDLAQKAVTEESTYTHIVTHATITEVTDQEIVWLRGQGDPSANVTGTLNRYTLKLHYHSEDIGDTAQNSCQLQHKQI